MRTRFTFAADEFSPVWSPDGSHVAFASRRRGHFDLYKKGTNGLGSEELLFSDDHEKQVTSWSSDGRYLLYVQSMAPTRIWALPLLGERKPFPLLNTAGAQASSQTSGVFSLDGRWVAFSSDESGREEVYVTSFLGAGSRRQISTAGGSVPRWRHDDKELFFVTADNKLMVAAVNGQGDSFETTAVGQLFEIQPAGSRNFYDVSPDGQRFLVDTLVQPTASTTLTLVVNGLPH